MKTKLIVSAIATALLLGTGCIKNCSKTQEQAVPPTPKAPVEKVIPPTEPEKKSESEEVKKLKSELNLNAGDKLIAEFNTNMGVIKAELFWEDAPMTVLNFVELAQGKKEWMDSKTQTKVKKPLYDGTIFHRVIKDFMIQGGDPLGTGIGGPGYTFKDEFNPKLRHSGKGILSMANAGPNTNGSQFFITERATPHLDNRHSVFGQVKDPASLDLISKIADVKTDARDKPLSPIVINNIQIVKG